MLNIKNKEIDKGGVCEFQTNLALSGESNRYEIIKDMRYRQEYDRDFDHDDREAQLDFKSYNIAFPKKLIRY